MKLRGAVVYKRGRAGRGRDAVAVAPHRRKVRLLSSQCLGSLILCHLLRGHGRLLLLVLRHMSGL